MTDFPVLVRLSPELNGFRYAKCKIPNGGDLRFADSSGNLIPHEIDTWNEGGESLVWVKVPTLTAATTITAYYGNSSPGAASAASVWDSGYVGVWHLGQSALPLTESTGVSSSFSALVGTVGYAASGIAGGAVDFSSSEITSRLRAGDNDNLDGFDSFTFEVWTKSDISGGRNVILSKRNHGASNYSYMMTHWNDNGGICYFSIGHGTDSQQIVKSTEMFPARGAWAHSAIVRDTTAAANYVYLNGASKNIGNNVTYDAVQMFSGSSELWLGGGQGWSDTTNPFNGLIDELRISRVARSADWIKATHDTIAEDGFAAYSGFDNNWKMYSHTFSVSFSGYAGSGALAGFPVLVRIAEYDAGTGKGIRGFSYSDMRLSNGGDLRFADADGDLIPHEIDTWNTSGESLVWVKVPTLTAATKITAYYGNSAPGPVSTASVWDSGYVGVWHLGQSALPLTESTGVSTPFFAQVGDVNYAASGIAGGAVDFPGTDVTTRLRARDDDDLDGFTNFTFEVWTKRNVQTGLNTVLSRRINGNTANNAYLWQQWNDQNGICYFTIGSGSANTQIVKSKDVFPAMGVWAHSAVVRDTDNRVIRAYLDGVSYASGCDYCGDQICNAATELWLGGMQGYSDDPSANPNGSRPFIGLIDELRISRVARSADWIKATHDTIAEDAFAVCSSAYENRDGFMILFK